MIFATMSTESFDWYVIAETEALAIKAFVKRWNASPYRTKTTAKSLKSMYSINIYNQPKMNEAFINSDDGWETIDQ